MIPPNIFTVLRNLSGAALYEKILPFSLPTEEKPANAFEGFRTKTLPNWEIFVTLSLL